MNLRVGRIGKLLAPGWGWCLRCETPWRFVRYHVTDYGDRGHGCLPLCEKCWAEMTPQRRIPFYHCLIWDWHEKYPDMSRGLSFDEEWAQVETAVLNGG